VELTSCSRLKRRKFPASALPMKSWQCAIRPEWPFGPNAFCAWMWQDR